MKKICKFNTAIGSLNIGDQIIMESFNNEMNYIFEGNYVYEVSTHQPLCHSYQDIKINPYNKFLKQCDYKFIAGTNIILNNMFWPLTQWNINMFNCSGYKDVILVGCGMNHNTKKMNLYTKLLYKKILNKNVYHSVRDEETKIQLEKMGFKAINTGCVTLWNLTDEFCKKIPKKKSNRVVFTLTDYCADHNYDQELINILNDNYEEIYYFPQGSEDITYLNSFKNIKKIRIIGANLKDYQKLLNEGNIDYVGTRLHAGIYAIKHGIRSIIITIDNRAREMGKNNHLTVIERNNLKQLSNLINSNINTMITINNKNIEKFKKQFK